MISSFAVTSARSLGEAYALLAQRPPGLKVLAGGTDLMVQLNAGIGLDRVGPVLDVWKVPELRRIERVKGADGDLLVLGALTTYSELITHPLIIAGLPALSAIAREVGAWAIQNRGTLGGNICNASPAGDTLPLLLAAEARFVLGGPRGERTVAADHFFLAYRHTALAADELVLRVEVPLGGQLVARKVGTRRAQSISKTLVAVKAREVERTVDGALLRGVRIGAGCVAPIPLRCRGAEAVLEGRVVAAPLFAELRAAIDADIKPIDDVRSDAGYRRRVTANVLETLVRQLAGGENASA